MPDVNQAVPTPPPNPQPVPADYQENLRQVEAEYRDHLDRLQHDRQRQEWFAGLVGPATTGPPPNPPTEYDRVMAGLGLNPAVLPAGQGAQISKHDQAAEDKAYSLLVGEIGEQAAVRIKAGGAYPIPSTLWPGIIYLIPRQGKVRILDRGRVIGESCIVPMSDMPWPDDVLTLIQRIRDDETVVFSIGIVNT